MWWQVAELFHFAETAGAQIRLRDSDALSLTWDCGAAGSTCGTPAANTPKLFTAKASTPKLAFPP